VGHTGDEVKMKHFEEAVTALGLQLAGRDYVNKATNERASSTR
jgi:hypothetical protein